MKVALLCGFISEASFHPDASPWGIILAATDSKSVTEVYPNFIRILPRKMMWVMCGFGYLCGFRLECWMWFNLRALGSFIPSSLHVALIINPVCRLSSVFFSFLSGRDNWAALKAARWFSYKSLKVTWRRVICKLTLSWCAHTLLAVFMGAKFVFASFLGPSPVSHLYLWSVLLALSSKTIHDSHMVRRQDIWANGV